MKEIKKLSEQMKEELHDACSYVKCAISYKDSDRELAEMYFSLSKAEVEHSDLEHAQAVRLIKAAGKDAPEAMKAVWDYIHEQLIEEKAEVKRLQAIYRE